MKAIIASLLVLMSTNLYAQNTTPTVVDSGFHTAYVPYGFDTNDHIQFVGEGVFSNTCFRPAYYQVNVDHANKKVMISPKAYRYDGMCAMAIVQYSQVVDLGLMQAGRYDIIQKEDNTATEMGKLSVRVATNSSADDFLYAPVSQAFWQERDGGGVVTLTGAFSNSCWKYQDTEVTVKDNVIVVQPISVMEEGVACTDAIVPFRRDFKINNLPKGRYLLHIRSTNAKAVNNLVDVL